MRFGKLAVIICNDAWQPAVSWLAAQAGAEVIIIPTNSVVATDSADGVDAIAYWPMLPTFIARMDQCRAVFVSLAGVDEGARFWGGSKIIDPGGLFVVEAS